MNQNVKKLAVIASCLLSINSFGQKKSNNSYNVLFIMVDDLRPELGCYGAPQIKTPNIDKLATESVTFTRAYCSVPVCGASRASLLTGILPTRERFVQFDTRTELDVAGAKTLPQVYKEAGYKTFSVGKVFHHLNDCEAQSWTEPAWHSRTGDPSRPNIDPETMAQLSSRGRGRIYEMPDVEDDAYPDGKFAKKTIEHLRDAKKSNSPFFIACGFIRPHMPFYAPKKYWDLYDRNSIMLAANQFRPKNAPSSLTGSTEYTSYHLDGLNPDSEEFHRMMKHGYFASVSYIDKLVGDLMSELKTLGLDKNTIVVLWGDHGWHLGEHNFWGKHNTMHLSMQVPLIVKVPGETKGKQSKAIVQTVDLFPTLCELTKLNAPKQLQGESFTKLIANPKAKFRDYAYCRFVNGDAIISERFAYTQYSGNKNELMLYDHKSDPDENENVVMNPEYKAVVLEMEKQLKSSKLKAASLSYD